MKSLFSSFLMIFMAEMGDKTQLTAMAFAARFKASLVFTAISIAIVFDNLIAVLAGSFFAGAFSLLFVKIAAGVLFIFFGLLTLYDEEEKRDTGFNKKVLLNPFITVAVFFFVSEFGDKTQIATLTLAMDTGAPFYVFIGACAGMIFANLIGICAGAFLAGKVSTKIIRKASFCIFVVFGLICFWNIFCARFGFSIKAALAEAVVMILTVLSVLTVLKINKKRGKEIK